MNNTDKPYRNYRTFKHLLYAASQGYPKLNDFLSTYDPIKQTGIIDIYDEPTNLILKLLATSFDPYLNSKRNMLKASSILRMVAQDLNKLAYTLQTADPYTETPDNLPMSDSSKSLCQNEKWDLFSLYKYIER